MRGEAEDIHDITRPNMLAAEGDHLVEHALGIAQSAVCSARDGIRRLAVELDFLVLRDEEEVLFDQMSGNPPQVEPLAAAGDGRGNFLRLGGREDEFHMRRWLLERFEQRIECARAEHVHLVDEVDFEFSTRGRVGSAVTQVADVFHAVVAGPVDLDDIEAAPLGDFQTRRALAARLRGGTGFAVQCLRQNAGGGGLADSARTHKKIGLRKPAGVHRILKRARDVLLPDDFGECLRTILAGENSVTHAGTLSPPFRVIQHDLKMPRLRRVNNLLNKKPCS